jgi:hypothetical protein
MSEVKNEPAIVEVPFYDGAIASGTADDDVWVALRPACERIGIGYKAQHEWLGTRDWQTVRKFRTVTADGRQREMVCISLETLSGWLLNINANDARHARIREKLIACQKDACHVMGDHYPGRPRGAPRPTTVPTYVEALLAQAQAIHDPRSVSRPSRESPNARHEQPRALWPRSRSTTPSATRTSTRCRRVRRRGSRRLGRRRAVVSGNTSTSWLRACRHVSLGFSDSFRISLT